MQPQQTRRSRRRDILVAFGCGAFCATMLGAAYAAVPLYSWFCRTTGFAGTPQVAHALPSRETRGRVITVRFDSNVAPGMPWTFEPERRTLDVHLGEVVTVYYAVTNRADRTIVGQAGYNVAPSTVGGYFDKINCFCFSQQTLQPGEKRDMAVVFYVDPKLAADAEQDTLSNITLSYTFYPVAAPATPAASLGPDKTGHI